MKNNIFIKDFIRIFLKLIQCKVFYHKLFKYLNSCFF